MAANAAAVRASAKRVPWAAAGGPGGAAVGAAVVGRDMERQARRRLYPPGAEGPEGRRPTSELACREPGHGPRPRWKGVYAGGDPSENHEMRPAGLRPCTT